MVDCDGARRIESFNLFQQRLGILNSTVDFPAGWESFHALINQLRQRFTRSRHLFKDQQPGHHPAVAVKEIAEVVVSTHFTPVGGILAPHNLLDKSMAGFAQHRLSASVLHNFQSIPGQAWVMDNFRTCLSLQECLSQQTDYIIALDEPAIFIKEKTAIKVTIPGYPDVCLMFGNGRCRGIAVLLQHWIRHAIRKMSVGLMMHLDKFERQMRLQKVNSGPGAAITCVTDNFQRLQQTGINICQEMFNVCRLGIDVLQNPDLFRFGELALFCELFDVEQPGVCTDRPTVFPHQLHAVVVLGIVAGRNGNPTIGVQV